MEAAFAAALIDPARPVPSGIRTARGAPDPLRFAVYRNNVHSSLTEALAAAYPVTRRIVGSEFFRAMSRAYVAGNLPDSPILISYGATFSAFIASFPPAAGLPYLADVARLERAWLAAYHAADVPALDAARLALIEPGRLPSSRVVAHPAAGLVRSRYAIGTIWLTHRTHPSMPIDAARAEAVLVTRPAREVLATVLPPQDAPFAETLLAGATLVDAASLAGADPAFEPGRALAGLVRLGAFAAIRAGEA